ATASSPSSGTTRPRKSAVRPLERVASRTRAVAGGFDAASRGLSTGCALAAERYVLAIDQGTTGTTAMLFDRQARIVGRGYREITQHYPRPGWVSHDAEELWQRSLAAVGEAKAAARIDDRAIAAIGIT